MRTRTTTSKDLCRAIEEGFVEISNASVITKAAIDHEEKIVLTPDQFMKDLHNYMQSGIFADTLDFKFEKCGDGFLVVKIGYVSAYCDHCIKVVLKVCDGVTMDAAIEKLHAKSIFQLGKESKQA